MERIKEAFTGKPSEERQAERAARADRPSAEFTGGVAGGPAYGSTATGYSEGTETGTTQVPVAQTTTATVPATRETEMRQGEATTCAQEYFTKVENRPVVKERIEHIKEHVPVEKEFVVETRATGVEREVGGGEVEHLGTTERVVAVTPPSAPCE